MDISTGTCVLKIPILFYKHVAEYMVREQCSTPVRRNLVSSLDSECTSYRQQGHAGSKALMYQHPPVLNWGCQPMEVVLYNGCKMTVVVVVVVAAAVIVEYKLTDFWKQPSLEPTFNIVGSRPSDHYFRSVCLFVCLSVCLFVQSVSQPSLIRFRSN